MDIRSIIQYRHGARNIAMCAALLVLASCQSDELIGNMPDKNTLNFRVGVTDEWIYGNNADATDGTAKQGNNLETNQSVPAGRQPSTSVAPAVRAFSLDAAPGADSLYLHTSVSDAIEAASFGKRKTVTRGTPIDKDNFYDAFGIFGYFADTWNDNGMPVYFSNVKVTQDNGDFWTPTPEYRWPERNQGLCIWAYAPYNTANLELPNADGTTTAFTYTVPDKVEDQKDLLIAEPEAFKGEPTSGTGTLALNFKHVLTAVRFVVGKDVQEGAIKSIALKGVHGKGTYKRNATKWDLPVEGDDIRNFTHNFETSAPVGGNNTSEGMQINPDEATFMMIPQTLPEGAQIEIVFTEKKTGGDYTLTASIAGDAWDMGQTITYRISITDFKETPTFEVTFNNRTFDFNGGSGTFTISSYVTVTKQKQEQEQQQSYTYDKPWTVEFSMYDAQTGSWGNWSSMRPDEWFGTSFATGGDGGHDVSQNFTVSKQESIRHDEHNDRLQKAKDIGSVYDLSTKGETTDMNTANCYIINRPGTYKLPLVYGNAIKNGQNNTAAYKPSVTGTNVLQTFVNHLGNPISDPYIYNNGNTFTPTNATLIWQDCMGMINNDEIQLTDNGHYLQFTTAAEGSPNFKQGNAIVAVLDEKGKVAWSWHIWVTDYVPEQATSTDDYKAGEIAKDMVVTNSNSNTYTFMGAELGLCNGNSLEYKERKVKVRFKQTDTQLQSDEIEITQTGYYTEMLGNCTYYQFGRKDPMLPLFYDDEAYNQDKAQYGPSQYKFVPINESENKTGRVSIELGIQHPYHFHYLSSTGNDWCEKTYHNLWNATQTTVGATDKVVKTIYDPSPVGYCVPPANAFTGLTYNGNGVSEGTALSYGKINSPYNQFYYEFANNMGWIFYCNKMNGLKGWNKDGGTIFYGCHGYRYYGAGVGGHGGRNGHYWSANPNNATTALYLYFTSSQVMPRYNQDCRAYGFAVRPIREQ